MPEVPLSSANGPVGEPIRSKSPPIKSVWPDHATPERNALWAGDPNLSRLDALKTALQGERRGYNFYYSVWGTTQDPEIAAMANEFVKEEAEHVEILERWIEREAYVVKTAKEAKAPDL